MDKVHLKTPNLQKLYMCTNETSHMTNHMLTLVEGVSAGLGSRVRWLVDQHRVHGHDIGSREALHVMQDLWQ